MKNRAREDAWMNSGYEGIARWGAILYAGLWLCMDVWAERIWILIPCNALFVMVFSLGLRRAAICACMGQQPKAKMLFWAFGRKYILKSAVLGLAIAALWTLPAVLNRLFDIRGLSWLYLLYYVLIFMAAEVFSFACTESPDLSIAQITGRACALIRRNWRYVSGQICLLCRQIVPYAVMFIILLALFYSANKNFLQDDPDSIFLINRIAHSLCVLVIGPRFYLRQNSFLLSALKMEGES